MLSTSTRATSTVDANSVLDKLPVIQAGDKCCPKSHQTEYCQQSNTDGSTPDKGSCINSPPLRMFHWNMMQRKTAVTQPGSHKGDCHITHPAGRDIIGQLPSMNWERAKYGIYQYTVVSKTQGQEWMRKHMGRADWSKAAQLCVSREGSAGTKAMANSRVLVCVERSLWTRPEVGKSPQGAQDTPAEDTDFFQKVSVHLRNKPTQTVSHVDNQRKLNPQSCLTLMCSRDLDPQSLQSPFLIQKLKCQNFLLTIPSSLSSLTDEPVYTALSVLSFLFSFFLLRQESIMQPRLTLNSVLSCDSLKMLQYITTPSIQQPLQRAHDTIYWMLPQIKKKELLLY